MSRLAEDEAGNIAHVGAGKLSGGVHQSGTLGAGGTWINTTPFSNTHFVHIIATGALRYRVTADSEYEATVNDHLISASAAQYGLDIAVHLNGDLYEYIGFYAVSADTVIDVSEYE